MYKKGTDCCDKNCMMDVKIDVTKIVRCICATILVITAVKCLPKLLCELSSMQGE